ncbi:hypothetical protein GZH46_02924, partial [Fragariocoptes setiger]
MTITTTTTLVVPLTVGLSAKTYAKMMPNQAMASNGGTAYSEPRSFRDVLGADVGTIQTMMSGWSDGAPSAGVGAPMMATTMYGQRRMGSAMRAGYSGSLNSMMTPSMMAAMNGADTANNDASNEMPINGNNNNNDNNNNMADNDHSTSDDSSNGDARSRPIMPDSSAMSRNGANGANAPNGDANGNGNGSEQLEREDSPAAADRQQTGDPDDDGGSQNEGADASNGQSMGVPSMRRINPTSDAAVLPLSTTTPAPAMSMATGKSTLPMSSSLASMPMNSKTMAIMSMMRGMSSPARAAAMAAAMQQQPQQQKQRYGQRSSATNSNVMSPMVVAMAAMAIQQQQQQQAAGKQTPMQMQAQAPTSMEMQIEMQEQDKQMKQDSTGTTYDSAGARNNIDMMTPVMMAAMKKRQAMTTSMLANVIASKAMRRSKPNQQAHQAAMSAAGPAGMQQKMKIMQMAALMASMASQPMNSMNSMSSMANSKAYTGANNGNGNANGQYRARQSNGNGNGNGNGQRMPSPAMINAKLTKMMTAMAGYGARNNGRASMDNSANGNGNAYANANGYMNGNGMSAQMIASQQKEMQQQTRPEQEQEQEQGDAELQQMKQRDMLQQAMLMANKLALAQMQQQQQQKMSSMQQQMQQSSDDMSEQQQMPMPMPMPMQQEQERDGADESEDAINLRMLSMFGRPGVDFPIYATPPMTGFSCADQQYPGYYADPKAQCQAFYICQADGRQDAFLCPNATIFNQQLFTCDWWYKVDCSRATQFYALNADLYNSANGGGYANGNGMNAGYDANNNEQRQMTGDEQQQQDFMPLTGAPVSQQNMEQSQQQDAQERIPYKQKRVPMSPGALVATAMSLTSSTMGQRQVPVYSSQRDMPNDMPNGQPMPATSSMSLAMPAMFGMPKSAIEQQQQQQQPSMIPMNEQRMPRMPASPALSAMTMPNAARLSMIMRPPMSVTSPSMSQTSPMSAAKLRLKMRMMTMQQMKQMKMMQTQLRMADDSMGPITPMTPLTSGVKSAQQMDNNNNKIEQAMAEPKLGTKQSRNANNNNNNNNMLMLANNAPGDQQQQLMMISARMPSKTMATSLAMSMAGADDNGPTTTAMQNGRKMSTNGENGQSQSMRANAIQMSGGKTSPPKASNLPMMTTAPAEPPTTTPAPVAANDPDVGFASAAASSS